MDKINHPQDEQPKAQETDLNGETIKPHTDNTSVTCWFCKKPIRRLEAWRLRADSATYYFHFPECYLRGKRKIRRKYPRGKTVICDPRDPVSSISPQTGCIGLILLLTLFFLGIVGILLYL